MYKPEIVTLPLPEKTNALAGKGKVWLVGAGPGAADLLTRRAEKVITSADVILYDSLISDEIFALANPRAEKIHVGKRKGRHAMTQAEISALMVKKALKGLQVARLKAGDPSIYGRSGEELGALDMAGVEFEIIPGVTAALAAAADAKLSLTQRGVASSLVFATGHDKDGNILPDWARLALEGATVALYMGRSVAGETAAKLMEAGLAASTPVLAVENASRPDKQLFQGVLSELHHLAAREDVSGPVLILIGEVAGFSLSDALQPLSENRGGFTILRQAS